MIKFKAHNQKNDTEFYGFGLSEMNIEKLRKGEPIYIIGDRIESIYDYLFFYGPTELDMHNILKKFIGPDTIIKGDKLDY